MEEQRRETMENSNVTMTEAIEGKAIEDNDIEENDIEEKNIEEKEDL